MRSCQFIFDGNPTGLISSVSLFGCLRMQGRLIFSVSSTDVEIENKIKIIVSFAPNSQIFPLKKLKLKSRKPYFEIWHRKKSPSVVLLVIVLCAISRSLHCNCSITVITLPALFLILPHDSLTVFIISLIIAIGFKLCKQFRVAIRLDEAS